MNFEDLTEDQKNEAIANFEKNNKITKAKQYLAQTDWYVSRKSETGKEIPEEVQSKRAQARLDANI